MSIPPDTSDTAAAAHADAVYRKVAWRLLPLLFLCYIAAYLDRVNVGFAKLGMQGDLQLSDSIYGLGAGIFFLGYSCSRCRATSSCTRSARGAGSRASWSRGP